MSSSDIPTLVKECTNITLKNRAIVIFTSTTCSQAEKDQVVFEIIQENRTKENAIQRQRQQQARDIWSEWFTRNW